MEQWSHDVLSSCYSSAATCSLLTPLVPNLAGYQARSSMPSDFDAHLSFALGSSAAALVAADASGYMVTAHCLSSPVAMWRLVGLRVLCIKGRRPSTRQSASTAMERRMAGRVLQLQDPRRFTGFVRPPFTTTSGAQRAEIENGTPSRTRQPVRLNARWICPKNQSGRLLLVCHASPES